MVISVIYWREFSCGDLVYTNQNILNERRCGYVAKTDANISVKREMVFFTFYSLVYFDGDTYDVLSVDHYIKLLSVGTC